MKLNDRLFVLLFIAISISAIPFVTPAVVPLPQTASPLRFEALKIEYDFTQVV